MTEREKLRNGLMADIQDPELQALLHRAKSLLPKFNACYLHGPGYDSLLHELVPDLGEGSFIAPPFYCDYGYHLHIGKGVFINFDCVFLDGADIYIEDHVLIGPKVQLLTPQHPFDYIERRKPIEASHSIRIGEDSWLKPATASASARTAGWAAGSSSAPESQLASAASSGPAAWSPRISRTTRRWQETRRGG